MKHIRPNTVCLILLALLFIWQFLLPKDFSAAARGLDTQAVTACRVEIYQPKEGETDPQPQCYHIDPASDTFASLMQQLSSNSYRKQIANMMGGGNRSGYSPSIYPYGIIYLDQQDQSYTILLYGKDMAFGKEGSRLTDFTPSGGDAFQTGLLSWIAQEVPAAAPDAAAP